MINHDECSTFPHFFYKGYMRTRDKNLSIDTGDEMRMLLNFSPCPHQFVGLSTVNS